MEQIYKETRKNRKLLVTGGVMLGIFCVILPPVVIFICEIIKGFILFEWFGFPDNILVEFAPDFIGCVIYSILGGVVCSIPTWYLTLEARENKKSRQLTAITFYSILIEIACCIWFYISFFCH